MATATKTINKRTMAAAKRILGREPGPNDFTQGIGLCEDDGYEIYARGTKAVSDNLARVIFCADLICAQSLALVRMVNNLSEAEWDDEGPQSSRVSSDRLREQFAAIERMVSEVGDSKCRSSLLRMDKAGQKIVGW